DFLERLTELQNGYNLANDELYKTIPILLSGNAYDWYKLNKNEWNNWEQFTAPLLDTFQNISYRTNIKKQLEEKFQKPTEKIIDFILHYRTLLN
ncbi:hypothetical protein, partial [Enterobacter cloacae complex sp. 4DZ3-17B2]|uniref:hypothetical protein n=1 Tax=Enterobacter cloacae complex sp. 4DZ3-17B2 TaxID=2511990 RepID=UPI0013ED122B